MRNLTLQNLISCWRKDKHNRHQPFLSSRRKALVSNLKWSLEQRVETPQPMLRKLSNCKMIWLSINKLSRKMRRLSRLFRVSLVLMDHQRPSPSQFSDILTLGDKVRQSDIFWLMQESITTRNCLPKSNSVVACQRCHTGRRSPDKLLVTLWVS